MGSEYYFIFWQRSSRKRNFMGNFSNGAISAVLKANLDLEDIEGMRDAVRDLMQFCVSDETVLACLNQDTGFYAMELVKLLDESLK